jgi:hypothetical protein
MSRNNGSADVASRDERGWDEGESLELEPATTGPVDAEDEVIVAADEDLDELDAPIDPEFGEGEAWDFEDLDLDDEVDGDEDDDEDDDDAEMHLLHELGIDLDAPDLGAGLDLSLHLDQDDPADDGVAA